MTSPSGRSVVIIHGAFSWPKNHPKTRHCLLFIYNISCYHIYMAQYKVPQDVEADDKLLGPFTFRQFIYLMVTIGSIALAVALFQIFPFLAILPVPFAIFFAVLALPLKKDQPMETYLAAVVSFHIKPRNRFWNPGQRESTIEITAPKVIEPPRARDITSEEANTRLSFLANIVDTEGNVLRGEQKSPPMQPDFVAENYSTPDVLETYSSSSLQQIPSQNTARRAEIVNQMRAAFAEQDQQASQPHQLGGAPIIPAAVPQNQPQPQSEPAPTPQPAPAPEQPTPEPTLPSPEELPPAEPTPELSERELAELDPLNSPVVIMPDIAAARRSAENKAKLKQLSALAHDQDLTVATIAKEANRIEEKAKDKEVYISLH